MKKIRFVNPYNKESELCDALIKVAKEQGYHIYPETSNWDIIIVKDIQIGIQAKLKDNMDVLAQAIEGVQPVGVNIKWSYPAPHIRAVLVPHASKEFKKIASVLGVFVIEGAVFNRYGKIREWIKEISKLDGYNKNCLTFPKKLCWIPEVEIDVPAGVSSPKTITKWKLAAVKLCLLLNEKGFLTSVDFKSINMSMTLWKQKKWLIPADKIGKLIKYVRNKKIELPDQLYPEIVEALIGIK